MNRLIFSNLWDQRHIIVRAVEGSVRKPGSTRQVTTRDAT
jgi:hypothetical protein